MYEIVKVIHILSISMMAGATLINGLLHMTALKSGFGQERLVTLTNIMRINRLIMAPSFVLIIASGTILVELAGYSYGSAWLFWGAILTTILVLLFVVGYRLENQLEVLADMGLQKPMQDLEEKYKNQFSRAGPVGGAATILTVVIVYLMVAQPI